MLLANQRSTGVSVPAPSTVLYASVLNGLGHHDGGSDAASARVLNDVTIMKISGLMNTIASAISTTKRSHRRTLSLVGSGGLYETGASSVVPAEVSSVADISTPSLSEHHRSRLQRSSRLLIPGCLALAEQPEDQEAEQDEEQGQHVAHRRRAAHLVVAQAGLGDLVDRRPGFGAGRALGDQVGLPEHVRRGDDRRHGDEREHRLEPRQRHVPELLPAVGAVHLRRLVEL